MFAELSILTASEINHILTEAREILGKVGVEVRHNRLREKMTTAGALPAEGRRLLFPARLIDAALQSAPSHFSLYDRQGDHFTRLGGDGVHYVPGSSGLKILDRRTDAVRAAHTADFVEYVRLADGLEHIAYLATAFSSGDDIETEVADAWRLYLCLTQSRKPVVSGAFTAHGVPRMGEMLALFRHDRADLRRRPLAIFTITASGMFRYGEDSCQNLIDCVEWGIPVEIVPVTLMGLIAPVTLVEATIFHVADCLAGLTMTQVLRPGAPILFGGAPAVFHMRTAVSPMAAIEAQKLVLAYVAVAKSLKLPTQAYMALSDGKLIDAQAGAETFGAALLAALSGINSISGPGFLDYLLVFSLEKLVLDNELCGQALHLARREAAGEAGTAVALARELLREEHLLTAEHTATHWPQALHLPGPTIERDTRENWIKAGRKSLRERARTEVEARLAGYQVVETAPEITRELERIIRSGLQNQTKLPIIPPPYGASTPPTRRRRRWRR